MAWSDSTRSLHCPGTAVYHLSEPESLHVVFECFLQVMCAERKNKVSRSKL